jgi:3-dehydroquinate synthase
MSPAAQGEELIFRFGERETRVRFVEGLRPYLGGDGSARLLVFDRHTAVLSHGLAVPAVVLPPGERSKRWAVAEGILRRALAAGLGRDGWIAGVGGGVVCDLAAFCASLYMRGCRLALAPTSLLAMVDAALGGKTGLNLRGRKNLLGTFYPAERILIWIGALASLPREELRAGLAEVIKTALLGEPDLLELLGRERARIQMADPPLMEEVVRRCLSVKGRIVTEDLEESGARAALNLGHTFGHALEAARGLGGVRHGEAVAWGLLRAGALAERLGLVNAAYVAALHDLLRSYGFRVHIGAAARVDAILAAMGSDKKKREGRLRLVLPAGIGHTVLQEVEEALIRQVVREG